MKFQREIFLGGFWLCSLPALWAQGFTKADWDRKNFNSKKEAPVILEQSLERKRVLIRQNLITRNAPAIFEDDREYEKLRRTKINEKTEELIRQIESLNKREGQESRKGELNMRLAELYYDRALEVAASESSEWERQMRSYDKLSEVERKLKPRPVLKTPKADVYRKKALGLYSLLEKESQGPDHGQSKMIRRDEVLYFLGSTLLDLGSRKQALPHFEEIVQVYSRSERAFSARLTLADLYFETRQFDKATSQYLRIAAGEGMSRETANLKPYAIYKLAWCYLNTSGYEKAVKAFEKTLEVSRNTDSDRRVAFEREALSDLAWAYALASEYSRGESYFESHGDKELLRSFRKNVAEVSRDRGEYDVSKEYYEKLLKEDPEGTEARSYSLEIADGYKRRGNNAAYARALADVGNHYSANSDWLKKQPGSSEDKKALVEEYVSLVRREAKAAHNSAQKKDRIEAYQKARPLYEAYMSTVPNPNPDTPENLLEMNFYYGELLYKIEDYRASAEAYARVGTGKYAPMAAYARVVALKAGAQKDSALGKELTRATEDFVRAYPEDERSGEILYTGAYDAFNAGQSAESIATLHKLVDKFSESNRGVESAERILFIDEKKGDLDSGIKDANAFLGNPALVKTGGPDFEKRLVNFREKAIFKKTEKMPEKSPAENAAKSRAYLELSRSLTGDVKEKALHNADVYARRSNDKEVQSLAQKTLLKEFPASPYAQDIYFLQGEEAARHGQWSIALQHYSSFLKTYKKDSAEAEKALWNSLYIRAHLEDVALPKLSPTKSMSAELIKDSLDYLHSFPKGTNRQEVLSFLAFRKGATLLDIKNYERMASAEDRGMLREAEVVIQVRLNQNLGGLLKKFPEANEASSDILKEALAVASFEESQAQYKNYLSQKIDYRPARFANSLQGKIKALEKLEKDYLRVVSFGNGDLALKSLERLSGLYRNLASDIDHTPGASKDPQLKAELEKYSKPLNEKGLSFLKTCLDKASELKIAGSGLEACRSKLLSLDSSVFVLSRDVLLEPQWLSAYKNVSDRPLFKVSAEAFREGRLGEFSLGATLLQKSEPPITTLEKAEIDNLMGLWNWRLGKGQAAVKIFRKLYELDSSELSTVRGAATKNLAAIYLKVGDYSQASDVLQNSNREEPDVALLLGLAYRAQNKNAEAAKVMSRALSKNKGNNLLLYNCAIALADSGSYKEAIQKMGAYIDGEALPADHPARAYLKKWKGMLK